MMKKKPAPKPTKRAPLPKRGSRTYTNMMNKFK